MRASLLLTFSLWGTAFLAAALPTQTALPQQIAPSSLGPTPTLALRAALPSFTGVSVSSYSYSHKSLSLHLPTSTCVQTITPDKNGYVPPGSCGALWDYNPSFGAAIVFSVLFGMLLIAHLAQAIAYRKGFCWVIVMASLWEFASYGFRTAGTRHQQSSSLATVSQILVLLAPIWVNAFAYMVFARIVHFFSPTRKVWKISPSILAFIFVSLDITSFIIQLIGGGMAGPGASPAAQQKGVHIYMGGIGLQEFFIVCFSALVIKFHFEQTTAEKTGRLAGDKLRWKWILYALYICLLAITVRIIFRLIEFSRGFGTNNPLPHKEAYFYALEALPMFFGILIWNAIHPGRFMQGPDAKLPPSWLSRKLCCCCHRKGKSRGGHERLASNANYEELKALRSRDPSPAQAERRGQPYDYEYQPSGDTLNVREPFRPMGAYNPPSRGVSPARSAPQPTSWVDA
ncbi:RTA1 domain protein [Exophiala viscosa]|uniref:RTA1 domain protein n=1 Tax=Exophiala viscosa TaxID=2486360 RepID=UPI00218E4157|nr:RTA1 domain protein [Exophiala viscosa]